MGSSTQQNEVNGGTPLADPTGSLYFFPRYKRTTYGNGKHADNVCMYCGRGGARSFSGNGQRAHKACIPTNALCLKCD